VLSVGCVLSAGAYVAARISPSEAMTQFFEGAHWTISSFAAVVLAWLGVRSAEPSDRTPRAWFASGLTVIFGGQVLWDVHTLTGVEFLYTLADPLFCALGPLCLIGIAAASRTHPQLRTRSFVLDVTSLTLVVFTLTLDLYLPLRHTMSTYDFVSSLST
jgi:hypothetical protein